MKTYNRNPEVLARQLRTVVNSQTPLSFVLPDTSSVFGDKWDRLLCINDTPLFKTGIVCESCTYFFERLPGDKEVNLAIADKLSSRFNKGVTELDDKMLAQCEALIPDGEYDVLLIRFKPSLCQPGDPDDYFSKQLTEQFRTNPLDTQTAYYLIRKTVQIHPQYGWPDQLMEFLVPLQQLSELNPERVTYYRTQLANAAQPTCLALGLSDTKRPQTDINFDSLQFLTHYMLDGHHKMYAAALEEKEITLLTYIRKHNYFCEFIDRPINNLYNACAFNDLDLVKQLIEQDRISADTKSRRE